MLLEVDNGIKMQIVGLLVNAKNEEKFHYPNARFGSNGQPLMMKSGV